jgi:hypothetical protein
METGRGIERLLIIDGSGIKGSKSGITSSGH